MKPNQPKQQRQRILANQRKSRADHAFACLGSANLQREQLQIDLATHRDKAATVTMQEPSHTLQSAGFVFAIFSTSLGVHAN